MIAQLTQVHQDYVLKLSTLAEVVEGIPINGRGDYFIQALDELLKPLTGDLDDHACREEDFPFPRLFERAPQSPGAVMIAEHAEIHERSAAFGRWYPIWREGDDSAYERWSEAALDLRGKFSAHRQKENLILFPLARRVLTAEEVQQLMRLGDR